MPASPVLRVNDNEKETPLVFTSPGRASKAFTSFAWLVTDLPFIGALGSSIDIQMIARDIHGNISITRYIESKLD
jgi:hypothetical protein